MTVKINPEALENAAKRLALIMSYGDRDMHWRALNDRQKQITTQYAREVVTKALGRLNTDTLRQLPQVQELMAEAWEEGAMDRVRRVYIGRMSQKTLSIVRERIAGANPYLEGDGDAS